MGVIRSSGVLEVQELAVPLLKQISEGGYMGQLVVLGWG